MTFEQFLKEGIRDYKVLDKNGYEVPGIIDSYIPNSLLDELVDYNSETKNLKFINRISRIEREKEIDGHKEKEKPKRTFDIKEVWKCYEFARNMEGKHNPDMIMNRKTWEIFRDDFRGKLGEIAVAKYIKENPTKAKNEVEPDFSVTPRGKWDKTDLVINGKNVSVKSIKQGSKFMLIETFRYDREGNCSYRNDDGSAVKTDLYILVRITIDPEINENDLQYNTVEELKQCEDGRKRKITYEILGGISHRDFWDNKHFAPAGIMCTKPNLEKVCNNKSCDTIHDASRKTKTEVLQQDNYVIAPNELTPIDKIEF